MNLCWNASYSFKQMLRWFTGIGPQLLLSFSPNFRTWICFFPNPATFRLLGSSLGRVKQITIQTKPTKQISTADSPELTRPKLLPVSNTAALTVYVSCTPSLPVFLCHFTHVSLNTDKLLNNSSSASKNMNTEGKQLLLLMQILICLEQLFISFFFSGFFFPNRNNKTR